MLYPTDEVDVIAGSQAPDDLSFKLFDRSQMASCDIPGGSLFLVAVEGILWILIQLIQKPPRFAPQIHSATQLGKSMGQPSAGRFSQNLAGPHLCGRSPPSLHPPSHSSHSLQFWTEPILPLTYPHQPHCNFGPCYFVPSRLTCSCRLIFLAHKEFSPVITHWESLMSLLHHS